MLRMIAIRYHILGKSTLEKVDVSGSEYAQKQQQDTRVLKPRLRRKISLFNGTEKLSDIRVPSQESNRSAIKRALNEMDRLPIVTRVVFRDRKGRQWTITRVTSFAERLKIQLLAS